MESVIVPNKMDRRMKDRVTPDVLIAHYEIVVNIISYICSTLCNVILGKVSCTIISIVIV